jgi:hypothetical protein
MLQDSYQIVNQLLITFALAVFIVTGFAGIALGVGLNVRSARVLGFLKGMNRWISLQDSLKPMEQPHDIDKAVYRHRRWFGATFAICGAYTVYMLLFSIDFTAVISALARNTTPVIMELAVSNMKWFLVLGGVLAFAVGIMMFVSTYALPAFDARFNRWYSSGKLGEGADKMHLTLDKWAEAFPRTVGLVIAFGSAAVLTAAIIAWLGN